MTGARTAVALYVAVAIHAVALLFLLLAPLPQTGAGSGIGLSLAGSGSVLAAPGVPSVQATPATPVTPMTPMSGVSARSSMAPKASHLAASTPSAPTTTPAPGRNGPGDLPGHAGGGGIDSYFARLRTHLALFRREVPDAASGRARVRFTVLSDGRVSALELESSSGSERLDAEALALVTRAQPLPLPPRGEPLRVQVPIYVGGQGADD